MSALDELLERQSGVVSRAQLLDHGVAATTIRRRIRRRELVMRVPGVYVNHTGDLSWRQRAWVAVLALEPAALCHRSALRADDGPGRVPVDEVIHVAVDRTRSPAAPPGVRLHHLARLDDKVRWSASPPRVRAEHAVLDVASEAADDLAAIAALADAVQARRTTAARLATTLATRERIARRAFLDGVLADVAAGTCSVLEHGYLTRVERPHGLPVAKRQVADSSRGPLYRDVEYAPARLRVELDGRLFHDNAQARDLDLDRDLDSALDGHLTVRLGWGQVHGRPCTTARKVGTLLQQRGWEGRPIPCPHCAGVSVRYSGETG
ncbi:type IV toxin-antitoxin system AbiEi family antitoxin domain-containing protein [Nocardioides rubriscoriae]|uniref:type IV toxin-antitoxin system AbiEi family antitoxin domain-containing protein n=1 Tax=Nocardioides rubriscoriae TaxID=642762 RepID=UPI0011E0564C|nr:type IV toxin-antitoxin system AbiEi family antitoxin domain-containing protein [Nocardioides rubriscoriae]